MPNIASAKKALRKSARNRVRNVAKKTAYKRALKSYRKLVSEKQLDEARTQLSKVFQTLDKAAKTNVLKKGAAARMKSRAAQLIARSTSASS